MSKQKNISMSVIRRLPRYYRFLSELKEIGVERVSSKTLSEIMNLTASQIRQDFNCFGGFGQQGYGYVVDQLHKEITEILGISNKYKAILIGVGNLGRAVATHTAFEKRGFELIGIFDKNKAYIDTVINNITVMNVDTLESFCKENNPSVAILCVPREAVEPIVKTLYESGIKNFWNFSHFDIASTYKDAVVENVHMSDSIMTLCYSITNNEKNI